MGKRNNQKRIIITHHAIVRYLERVANVNFQELFEEEFDEMDDSVIVERLLYNQIDVKNFVLQSVLNSDISNKIKTLKTCHIQSACKQCWLVIEDYRIITCLPKNAKQEALKQCRDKTDRISKHSVFNKKLVKRKRQILKEELELDCAFN